MGDRSRGDAKLAKFREGAANTSKNKEDRDAFFAQYVFVRHMIVDALLSACIFCAGDNTKKR